MDLPDVESSGIQWYFLATNDSANCDDLTEGSFGTEITMSDRIMFSGDNRELMISSVDYVDEGCYSVRVENTAGFDTATAWLDVQG